MGSTVPAHTLSTHILPCVSMYSSTSFLLLFLPLEGISAGSVCSDCVSFGSVWPPPCFETGRSLSGNDLKSVKSSTAEKCQELCQGEKECRVWSLGEGSVISRQLLKEQNHPTLTLETGYLGPSTVWDIIQARYPGSNMEL